MKQFNFVIDSTEYCIDESNWMTALEKLNELDVSSVVLLEFLFQVEDVLGKNILICEGCHKLSTSGLEVDKDEKYCSETCASAYYSTLEIQSFKKVTSGVEALSGSGYSKLTE